MITSLSPPWELSDEHAMSSYGKPVLVNRSTGDAYGAGDILQAYNSWGFMSAARVVARLARTKALDADGDALVARFLAGPPR
jgi:hypothetical protein